MNGRAERDAVLDLLEETRSLYLARARAVAITLAGRHGDITINDVRAACPLPDGIDPRVLGAVFRSPGWEAVGFISSARRTCHARPIRTFRYIPRQEIP